MTDTTILVPGHPAGYTCSECGVRRAHLDGAHQDDVCKHRICLICAGCDECEQAQRDREHGKYVDHAIKMLNEAVSEAQRGVNNASKWLRELTGPAYDIELAEGADGADAQDDLAAAGRLLRNVERIIVARQRLLDDEGN